MADRRLAVDVTVDGDAEQKFKQIGKSAGDSGRVIADGMKSAAGAVAKFTTDVDESAKTNEAYKDKLTAVKDKLSQVEEETKKADAATVGFAFSLNDAADYGTMLADTFQQLSTQAYEHEQGVASLTRIYGDGTDAMLSFASQIQDTTLFDEGDAEKAIRLMGTLKLNYQLTDDQIRQLVQTSADLATMTGMTLADAAQRVQSAIRGEAESAEALGLTMNQAAIDSQGLTLSMTNAQAAAFRFDAMMGQTAFSVGAAGEATETAYGQVIQFHNEINTAARDAVAATGPIGQIAAGIAKVGIEAGPAVAEVVKMGGALSQMITAAGGISTLASTLAGPLGIIAGLGLAAVASWKLAEALNGSGSVYESAKKTHEAVVELNNDVLTLASSFEDAALGISLVDTTTQMGQFAENTRSSLEWFQELWDKYGNPYEWMNGREDIYAQNAQVAEDIDMLTAYIEDFGWSAEEASKQVDTLLNSWGQIADSQNEQAIRDAIDAWNEFQNSAQREEDWDKLVETISGISGSLDKYTRAEIEAKLATDDTTDAIAAQTAAIEAHERALKQYLQVVGGGGVLAPYGLFDGGQDYSPTMYDNVAAAEYITQTNSHQQWLDTHVEQATVPVLALADAWTQVEGAVEHVDDGTRLHIANVAENVQEMANEVQRVADSWEAATADTRRATLSWDDLQKAIAKNNAELERQQQAFAESASAKDAYIAKMREEADAYRAARDAATGLSDTVLALRALGGSGALDLSINVSNASGALASGFHAIVTQTNAMGQLAQNTWDWSNSLTEGAQGQSKLDQLMIDGKISAKTYGEALDANHRIMKANESVQEDVLRIQAKQLPVIAALAEEHARYVDTLADASVEEQTVALGYMDQAEAARALSVAQLAASATTATMQAQASDMIVAMAEADPILKAMLIDMGLLTEKKGKLEVDFGDVEDSNQAVIDLTDALDTLTGVIAQAFGIEVTLDDDDAYTRLLNIWTMLQQLDGYSVASYASVLGIDATSLAGTGTYVNMPALQPVIPAMAGGGYAHLVGEYGPEIVSLQPGTIVTNTAGTRGRLDPLGRGRGAPSQTIYKGPVHQTITLDQSALRERSMLMSQRRG